MKQFIAHMGIISKRFKGNTLEAIKETMKTNVDGIEIDVKLSKDNVLFLYHDIYLEENTNGKGIPEKFNWDQLKQLKYKGTNSHLVSLEEVIKIVGKKKQLFIEAKADNLFNANFTKELIRLIRKYKLEKSAIVLSFNPIFLLECKLRARDIKTMFNFTTVIKANKGEIQAHYDAMPWYLKRVLYLKIIIKLIRPDILGPRFDADQAIIKSHLNKGKLVYCWTVDDTTTAKKVFKLGVSGIISNDSLRMMKGV